MDQARSALIGNIARYAGLARERMALNLESVSRLTGLAEEILTAIDQGDENIDLSLDELTGLALFLGLTASGVPRQKPPGSN